MEKSEPAWISLSENALAFSENTPKTIRFSEHGIRSVEISIRSKLSFQRKRRFGEPPRSAKPKKQLRRTFFHPDYTVGTGIPPDPAS